MDDEINDHDGISPFLFCSVLFYPILFSLFWHARNGKQGMDGWMEGWVGGRLADDPDRIACEAGTKDGLCRGFGMR